jgi:hypothetical protein
MLTLITDHFRNIKKNICCTKLFVKNISKILSFILLDDHLSNSLFKFNALWNRTFFDGLGILKPQYISFSFIYNSACNNKTPTEVTKSILMHSTIIRRRTLQMKQALQNKTCFRKNLETCTLKMSTIKSMIYISWLFVNRKQVKHFHRCTVKYSTVKLESPCR